MNGDFATATKRATKTDGDLATVIYEDWAIPSVELVISTCGQVNLTAFLVKLAADDQRLWVEGWCWCVGPDLTRERGLGTPGLGCSSPFLCG